MHIDHEAAEFPYLQLAALIRDRITSGTYRPGAKLPSNIDLVGRTGLSPMTVRRAMKVLEAEGLVDVIEGRGTFVRKSLARSRGHSRGIVCAGHAQ